METMNYNVAKAIEVAKVRKQAFELTEKLVELTNVISDDVQLAVAEGMADALSKQHRTLQQSFVGVTKVMFTQYAGTRTDARNESAVEFAGKIANIDHHFPYI